MKLSIIAVVLLMISVLSGCATSKFHIGYHHTEDKGEILMRTSKSVVEESKLFEERCVGAFIRYDLSLIKNMLASKLTTKMTVEEIEKVNEILKGRYKFTDLVSQLYLGNNIPNSIPYSSDNYERFDYIESGYILEGTPGAMVKLQTTKVNGELKLSGFVVISEPNDPNPDKKALNYFFFETEDKDGALIPRFGDTYEETKK